MSMWSRLRNTLRGDRHRAEIEEELQFHLEMDAAGGHDRRQSRLRLGNPTRIAEETRAIGIVEWLDSAWQDARFGLRQLRRTPVLTLAVVLSLAVGLGANTAIFTLVDAAILRPLPVDRPEALVLLEWTNEDFPPDVENHNGEYRPIAGGRHQGSSVPASLYRRLAARQTVFSSLMAAGAYPEAVAIAADRFPAEQVSVQYVSSNFFQGLGTPPAAGRPFLTDDDHVGAEPVVIVSDRFWAKRFARGEDAIGASVRINNIAARIVGVAPAGFFGLRTGQWADVYAPLAAKVAFQSPPGAPRSENDRNWWVRQVGRLKPGIDEAAAGEEIRSLFRNLAVPEGTTLEPAQIPTLITLPGGRGVNALNSGDVNALWILLLLVGVLLLIVCANVANLLLSRAVGRRRESTVRLALGAPRARLFRQHLIESGMLALIGGAAGLAVGYALAQSIHVVFQTGRDASNAFDLHLDPRVLAFTSLLSLLTALLFGLAPAAQAARGDLNGILKAQTKSVMSGRLRLPRLLVTVQIALCLAALVAAGLLGRSLEKLKWNDIGFDRKNLLYASVSPSRAGYTAERTAPYVERLREELSRLPGVESVSPVSTRLLSGGGNNGRVNLPGRRWDDDHRADLNGVGDGFFATLRIPLLAGRTIERRDMDSAAEVAVVDELFAARFFPNQIAVGRRFGVDPTRNDRVRDHRRRREQPLQHAAAGTNPCRLPAVPSGRNDSLRDPHDHRRRKPCRAGATRGGGSRSGRPTE